jgi:hypothetical protein
MTDHLAVKIDVGFADHTDIIKSFRHIHWP